MSSPPTDPARSDSLYQAGFDSPVGALCIEATETAIVRLRWAPTPNPRLNPILEAARDQLAAYFDDPTQAFDLPLAPAGTDFQTRVWSVMQTIPPGQTLTYGCVAARLSAEETNSPLGAARAVGMACGANPIPILIPCHRITAAGGRLGGFSGGDGQDTKAWLLGHEGWPGLSAGPLFDAAGATDSKTSG